MANIDHRYTVYAAVFLFKAGTFGALLRNESSEITNLARQFIAVLEEAAINDCHIARRFASLLKCMWLSDRHCPSLKRPASSNTPNLMFGPSLESRTPRGVNLADAQDRNSTAFNTPFLEPAYVPTPDFNLFFPEFSNLESELVGLGVGAPEFPM